MPEDKKHFDVAQPGQLRVSHTSRPVIVEQQQSVIADPMMQSEEQSDKPAMPEHKQPNLRPLHQETVPETRSTSNNPSPTEDKLPAATDTTTDKQPEAGDNPAVQKLIEDKTYRLPVKSPTAKNLKAVLVMLGIVVLVGAGFVYFAMNR